MPGKVSPRGHGTATNHPDKGKDTDRLNAASCLCEDSLVGVRESLGKGQRYFVGPDTLVRTLTHLVREPAHFGSLNEDVHRFSVRTLHPFGPFPRIATPFGDYGIQSENNSICRMQRPFSDLFEGVDNIFQGFL